MTHALGDLLIVASLLAPGETASPADPEIQKCEDASGNVSYQDDPCPVVRPEPVDARSGAAAVPRAAAPAARPATTTTKGNRTSIAGRKAPATLARPPREPKVFGQRSPGRLPAPLDDGAHLADPRFASPERTWQTFVTAMRNGDRAAALACLTSSALTEFGPRVQSFPVERLREIVSAFSPIEVEGDVGPFWSIRVLRPNERPKWIFLERTGRGEWRIAAL